MDNSGNAFPCVAAGPAGDIYDASDLGRFGGLSKREYFAALAMNGMLDNSAGDADCAPLFAWAAVRFADALLAELEKSNG